MILWTDANLSPRIFHQMTKNKLTFLLLVLVVFAVNVYAAEVLPIEFSDAELRTCKQQAIRAINSPEAWQHFPQAQHDSHYKAVAQKISYLFRSERPNEVTVVVPTTKVKRHQYYVAVTFDHFGKIMHMEEGFWL